MNNVLDLTKGDQNDTIFLFSFMNISLFIYE